MANSSALFSVQNSVGRLIEARVRSLSNALHAREYCLACATHIEELRGKNPILLADHRDVALYSPEVTRVLIDVFRTNNTLLERVAIVLSPSNALLNLQLQRLAREAQGHKRRVFRDTEAAVEFLSEALSAKEQARALSFLTE